MTYDEYQPEAPSPLRTAGKYIAFFAGAALCFLVPALGLAALKLTEVDDRLLREAMSQIAVMTGSAICVLISGIQLARGWTLSGALLMIFAAVVFVVGMPDR